MTNQSGKIRGSGPEKRTECASPPCYADDYEAPSSIERAELVALLNELLEGERAGARVAIALRAQAGAEVSTLLREIAHDEGHFCAMLTEQLKRLEQTPSQAVGAFHDKVMALPTLGQRLALLNKGQAWVVRTLRAALPRIDDDELERKLRHMLDVHVRNIERCDALAGET